MLLYHRPTSGHSYKVRLLLSFLGIEYDEKIVNATAGKNVVDPAYFDLNPRGQIPTIDDNGHHVWGSTAILVYIATRYDAARTWLPAAPDKMAMVMQWMELAQNEVNGMFLSRAIQLFGYPGDLASAQQAGNRALDILEKRLANRQWLAADGPTIGDIACFPYVALAWDNGFDLDARPAVRAWIDRIASLKGFVPMPGMEPLLSL
ncbi:glutathione S-transferase family protein [Trinickia sp.]|uniref:glutathione S-transferase family protein n=1 Tax=Trinickia sp. TaxID=2571163 RepID=UPI003F800D3E